MDARRRRTVTYIVLGVVFVILVGVAIGVFRSAREDDVASRRADQLRAAFATAGLPQPTKEQLVRVLGRDGREMCDDPTGALRKASLQAQMSNGAAGPGQRPVVSDKDTVQGEVLAIGIYCPDKLAEFTNYIKNNLTFDDVVRD